MKILVKKVSEKFRQFTLDNSEQQQVKGGGDGDIIVTEDIING